MLAAVPTAAFAESVVCHAIRRGESATQAARRLTGDSWNAYRPWFQIKNASSRFVPKSQYNRVRGGWQACLIRSAAQASAVGEKHVIPDGPKGIDATELSEASEPAAASDALASPVVLAAAAETVAVAGDRSPSDASGLLHWIGGLDLTVVWLAAAMAVPWFGWRMLDDHLTRRKTTAIVMRHFAERFVHEFERPLLWYDGERPVRMRVRCSARRRRLDVLLAPGRGRRYPNLVDHKKNVEYDVARVMSALGDDSFVCGPLSTQAGWVVVPFQFVVRRGRGKGGKAGPNQSGVTCISSF
jgi:hypothetical protein